MPKIKAKVIEVPPTPKESVKALRESVKVITTEERLAVEREAIKNAVIAEEANKMGADTGKKMYGEAVENNLQIKSKGLKFSFDLFGPPKDFQKRVKQNQRRSQQAKAQIRRKWN